jgi:hypothetical protein
VRFGSWWNITSFRTSALAAAFDRVLVRGVAPSTLPARYSFWCTACRGRGRRRPEEAQELLVLLLGGELPFPRGLLVVVGIPGIGGEHVPEGFGVVGGHDRLAAVLETVAQTEDGMVRYLVRTTRPRPGQLGLLELVVLDGGGELGLADRPIPVGELGAMIDSRVSSS